MSRMTCAFWVSLVAFLPQIAAAQQEKLIVIGARDAIRLAVQQAMKAEHPEGSIGSFDGQEGYVVRFKPFLSSPQRVDALIVPMVRKDEYEISAHKVGFFGTKPNYAKELGDQLENLVKEGAGGLRLATSSDDLLDMKDRIHECFYRLEIDPELAAIREKVALGKADNQTFAMKANESVPSESEKNVIGVWATKRDKCVTLLRTRATYYSGNPYAILDSSTQTSVEALLMSLYKGNITYGKFATYRQELADHNAQTRQKIAAAIEEKNAAAQERARQIALDEEKVAIARSRAWSQAAQAGAAVQAANRPPPSTSVTCTSFGSSGMVTTNCR